MIKCLFIYWVTFFFTANFIMPRRQFSDEFKQQIVYSHKERKNIVRLSKHTMCLTNLGKGGLRMIPAIFFQ